LVSRKIVSYISGKIRHLLERETVAEQPVSPEERLAICLYRLGRGDYLYTIGEMSDLGTSTSYTIVSEVCQTLVNAFGNEPSKHMPECEVQFAISIHQFQEMCQFPCAWAALDGCHIPIKCPPSGPVACTACTSNHSQRSRDNRSSLRNTFT